MSLTSLSQCNWFAEYLSLPLVVTWSSCKSLTISHGCLLPVALSSSPIELMHISHCLPWMIAVSNCLFKSHGVAAYLSLSPIVSCCLSLSLLSCEVASQTVAGCLSLSLSLLWRCCMSLTASYCLPLYYGVAVCFSLFPKVFWCLSQSLPVPLSCCISLTISHCFWQSFTVSSCSLELLHVSHCLLLLLALSYSLHQSYRVSA